MAAARACSVRYFCLGALLVFVGSVLLVALGFTIVLPHQATATWPRATCTVLNTSFSRQVCACQHPVTDLNRCLQRYPCLRVTVGYNRTLMAGEGAAPSSSSSSPSRDRHQSVQARRVAFRTGILYRNWEDSFFQTCSLHECGDEEWNVKAVQQFQSTWGGPGTSYPCFYDPANPSSLLLRRMPTAHVVHAILWPALSLVLGAVIWLGLCFGCWRIEVEDSYPQRHVGPYGLL